MCMTAVAAGRGINRMQYITFENADVVSRHAMPDAVLLSMGQTPLAYV